MTLQQMQRYSWLISLLIIIIRLVRNNQYLYIINTHTHYLYIYIYTHAYNYISIHEFYTNVNT